MIKPEELRIGNYIMSDRQYFKEPVIGVVYQVSNVGICFEYNEQGEMRGISNPLKHILPIPLTEEWLVKLGFVIDSDYDYRNYILPRNNFIVSVWMRDDQPGGFEIPRGAYWGDMFKHIPFVHSLQNLYFVIVGEELKLA